MDFDADGDIDIYVDGYLLEQTESEFIVNSNIKKLLFSKAVFSDYNNDSYPELFIIGIGEDPVGREYDYVNIYSNNNGDYFLKDNFKTPIEGMRTSFWHDFDQHGSPDLIYYNKKKVYFFANDKYITNVDKRNILISDFSLSQNYPNPFNPTTTIKFAIPSVERPYRASLQTKLIVYDILGREVKTLLNKPMQPGTYEVEFNGSSLPSGVYLYRIKAGSFVQTKKMILVN